MSEEYSKEDIVQHRIQKAKDNFIEAKWAAKEGFSNTSVNRLYYACFYAVIALLLRENIAAKTHSGVRHQFGLHFIETGKFDKDFGKFFSDLFESRQESDYEDFFIIEPDAVKNLVTGTEEFINKIESYLKE